MFYYQSEDFLSSPQNLRGVFEGLRLKVGVKDQCEGFRCDRSNEW